MKSNSDLFEKKTAWVVILTAITMVVEIFFGYISGSMALLADGIHMGSHVFAIGLSWIAYVLIRKKKNKTNYTFNADKALSLSGYTSGLMLLFFAFFIMFKALQRFFIPVDIHYNEALLVAVLGLLVNIICAIVLHHDHKESDHNIRAAYIHVLADALTSFTAIIGLVAAKIWGLYYIDAIAALISSMVIIKWSVGLLVNSGRNLAEIRKAG